MIRDLVQRTPVRRSLASCILLAATPLTTSAQNPSGPQRIGNAPCAECRLDLVQIATVPTFANGVALVQRPMLGYAAGTFVAAFTYDGQLGVWRDGRLSTLGRSGGGPNEFPSNGSPRGLDAFADDRVALISGNRLTIVSSDGSRILEQHVLPWIPTGMTVVGGEILVGAPSGEITSIGQNGEIVRNFRPPFSTKLPRLAASGDTAVWVGDVTRYRFDLLTLTGSQAGSFDRDPDWIRGASADLGAPKVTGLMEIDGGLLLVVLRVPDPAFDKRLTARPGPIQQLRDLPIYDTVIEVIDPKRRQLMITARYDDVLFFVGGSNYLFATREASDGEVYLDVFEPQLRR